MAQWRGVLQNVLSRLNERSRGMGGGGACSLSIVIHCVRPGAFVKEELDHIVMNARCSELDQRQESSMGDTINVRVGGSNHLEVRQKGLRYPKTITLSEHRFRRIKSDGRLRLPKILCVGKTAANARRDSSCTHSTSSEEILRFLT